MSDPFLGELRLVSFNFAPKAWTMANGQLMPINQNQALFSVMGTTYGGDGMRTFGLPNLQGRAPVGTGNGIVLGEVGGEVSHTLNLSEMPQHNHMVNAVASAAGDSPSGTLLGAGGAAVYNTFANPVSMNSAMIGVTGGSQPHNNQQPYLVMTWIIALQGIFPSQN